MVAAEYSGDYKPYSFVKGYLPEMNYYTRGNRGKVVNVIFYFTRIPAGIDAINWYCDGGFALSAAPCGKYHCPKFDAKNIEVYNNPNTTLQTSYTEEKLKDVGGIGNTGAPATITFAYNDEAKWFYGRLDGHLSVRVSGPSMLGFSVPTNTMDGTIAHAGGGGNITMGGAWPNLKRIESVNGGFVDIRNSVTINPKATIDIDGSSQIKVATGLTLTVRTLRINGVELPIGTYSRFSSAVDGRFESNGNGFVK
jgi:hypothetical protein